MFKNVVYSLSCAALLLFNPIAQAVVPLTAGRVISYELNPKEPEEFINVWFWTIIANCTLYTQDLQEDVFIEILKKSGKINGLCLYQGDSLTMPVHNAETFLVVVDSGGKVRLTNQGLAAIKAKCTAN